MSEPKTVACPICSEPYVFYPFMAGDQSACPTCRGKARANAAWGHRPLGDKRP